MYVVPKQTHMHNIMAVAYTAWVVCGALQQVLGVLDVSRLHVCLGVPF